MRSTERPLRISGDGKKETILKKAPFEGFLQAAFSTLIAVVLAWRLFVFPQQTKIKTEIEEGKEEKEEEKENEEDPPSTSTQYFTSRMDPQVPGPSSLLSMLSTDSMPPSSSSSDGEERPAPPVPSLVQANMAQGGGYLDAIIEEESDDLRSISSASFASPRTIVEGSLERSTRQIISGEPVFPLYSVIEPITQTRSPEAVDLTLEDPDEAQISENEQTIIERPITNIEEVIEERPEEVHKIEQQTTEKRFEPASSQDLLKGLIKLSKPEKIEGSSPVPDRSLLEQMMDESKHIEQTIDQSMKRIEELHTPRDADRDQTEEIVYQEEPKPAPATEMEIEEIEEQSLASASITLDQSRDSVLDTSQPIDESLLVEQQMSGSRPMIAPPSPPLDLPPPTTTTTPSPAENLAKDSIWNIGLQLHKTIKWKLCSNTTVTNTVTQKTTSILQKSPDLEVDIDGAMRRAARYGQTYGDAAMSHMRSANEDRGSYLSSPPMEPPPPPPQPSYTVTHPPTVGGSTRSYSREDLLSDAAPSRSTIREIPVQRAGSASQTASSFDYSRALMPSSGYDTRPDLGDEYYRREVISRTVITRSQETLSQPPLGRSSPIERYVSYPDPNTRETKEVEYRYNVTRNVEEEERRIKEAQERRRNEEESRRRREDEMRKELDRKEKERLEILRREWERKERELESVQNERERNEKDRIDRDRAERERIERQRRAEWDAREAERRALEEQELERRRQEERERLERIRLEEERVERERLERERKRMEEERLRREREEAERIERERIERERLERERIEIERIERIKRERVERERQDRERELEEQRRLQKEREELERIERERRELERREREALEAARREAEAREKERLEDEAREARRREEERREKELLADIQRQAEERERLRRMQEIEERERLERIRFEQERLEKERLDFERRERERQDAEKREHELLAQQRAERERRERERMEDELRERQRQEEERRERERRERERQAAIERERQRRAEEEAEMRRLAELERSKLDRDRQREAEVDRDRERIELERRAVELKEWERREQERRDRERDEEEKQLRELKDRERRNQEIREKERIEAIAREETRRKEDRRSREHLDIIVREKTEKERFELEKRRLLEAKEARERKRNDLTSPETLGKLVRPAYFSRENLSNLGTEVTTKVERQVIERVDRNLFVDDQVRTYPITLGTSGALGYRESPLDLTTEEERRERMFSQRVDDLNRSNSARTSRLRSKVEKARRDFITGQPESTQESAWRRSQEDLGLRPRPELRGPLLQKFHSGQFSSRPEDLNVPYPRVGPSPYSQEFDRLLEEAERKYATYRNRLSQPNLYSRQRHFSTSYLETDIDTGRPDMATDVRQMEETNLDDVHRRSGSVVDYTRVSRRDLAERNEESSHTRSKSADYLLDRLQREETLAPENELQKMAPSPSHRVSEHEMRFRKSTERLPIPDWYRENRPTVRPTDVDMSLPRPTSTYDYRATQSATTTPMDSFMPRGMFDRYRDEIEDMRRSRTSLHQIEPPRQDYRSAPMPAPRRTVSHEVIAASRADSRQSVEGFRNLPGYTVSEVPDSWNLGRNRTSRVVEVADTFAGAKRIVDKYGQVQVRYGGRVTIEEVLDSIFQQTAPRDASYVADGIPQGEYTANHDGPSIYTKNYMLMDQVVQQPDRAESLLQNEKLFVRCAHCHKTRELGLARLHYVSCKHCYSYYCSRNCRVRDWPKHQGRCSYARINTLCKDVIMKVREDPQAQLYMSKIAREGYAARGRGSVNIRLSSPTQAHAYTTNGWEALQGVPMQNLLFYYTIAALISDRKEPSLVALCRQYDPNEKFILSVSIIADIEHCPQTPPPETIDYPQENISTDAYSYSRPKSDHQVHFSPNIGNGAQPYTALVPTDV
ncbi:unnamed protein product, partial [Mesorhabditis belari]|uniref:MYND-type domain-containing protein n=1 Tax=Mesorhabditis belari TaxID=2138241 RepID=A0AAF3FKV6_9BILA